MNDLRYKRIEEIKHEIETSESLSFDEVDALAEEKNRLLERIEEIEHEIETNESLSFDEVDALAEEKNRLLERIEESNRIAAQTLYDLTRHT